MLLDKGVEGGEVDVGAQAKVGIAIGAEPLEMLAPRPGFEINVTHVSPPYRWHLRMFFDDGNGDGARGSMCGSLYHDRSGSAMML